MPGQLPERRMDRGSQVGRAVPAGRVRPAERRVPADLLTGRPGVPEEVAGRVDTDHHRAPDASGVAPGVDHRRTRPCAFAEQVDLPVAEVAAHRVEVVDPLGQRVAGEVDAGCLQAHRAGPVCRRHCRVRLRGQQVARVLARGHDLGAVEPGRAVDAAVADEDDVVPRREPGRVREAHVADPGAALQAEDRVARMRRGRVDTRHRQRNQPRLRVVPVLAHDERPAVGERRPVVARMQRQLIRVRARGDADTVAASGEMQVDETERYEPDQRQRDDTRSGESGRFRGLHDGSFSRRVDEPRLAAPPRRRLVARPERASYRPTIPAPTQVGGTVRGRGVRSDV